MSLPSEVFLFPLPDAVLFPETSKPLHIFEPRYLQMLDQALSTNTPIALAMADPFGEVQSDMTVLAKIRKIAGYGKPHVLEKKSDGTVLILLEGLGKVEVFETQSGDQPFLTAVVKPISEAESLHENNLFLFLKLEKQLEAWLQDTVNEPIARFLFQRHLKTAAAKINHFCSLTIGDSARQQALLELNDINDRLISISMDELATGQTQ